MRLFVTMENIFDGNFDKILSFLLILIVGNLAKNFPFSFFLLLYFLVGAFFIHNFILLFYMIKTKVQEVTIFLRNGIRSFHNYLNYFCNFENYFSQLNKTFFFSEQIFAKVPLSGVPLSGE